MMRHEESLVFDDEVQTFQGATLQINNDSSVTNSSNINKLPEFKDTESLLNGNLPNESVDKDVKAKSTSSKDRPNTLALVPWSGESAHDFFSFRDGLVNNAIKESTKEILTEEDGEFVGAWLLTEISYWDNEKERLVLLTSKYLISVKYDFITLKILNYRRVLLELVDTVVIGELTYPTASLIPHLDGLASGLTDAVKYCVVKPIQEKLAGMPPCTANPMRFGRFEPSSRNFNGVRISWTGGNPLPFMKKWNPFEKELPLVTFASHPLLWHREGDEADNKQYNIDDFTVELNKCLERRVKNFQCSIQHKPVLVENYVGVGALIHNKNSLGFFKVRGKFSF